MWEYEIIYTVTHEVNELNMQSFLNSRGKNRWELVEVISKPAINQPNEFASHTFIFKRPKK